ncbi:hypothetical protein B5X24_HaOG200769 [Helicoverpa armigera]|uniref:Gustatory receptor n=1 Tax=Helicoverpa armigera TaxID=29058 RepID=A0A2W1BNW4_HELAM|nr:hypothetical protein B5X24_HaOG200769 [Helicoverpa armigera]
MENNMTEEKNQENKQNMEYSEENECKIKIQKVMYTVKPVTVLEYCFAMFKYNFCDGQLQPTKTGMKIYSSLCIIVYALVFFRFFFMPAVGYPYITLVPPICAFIHYVISSFIAFFLSGSKAYICIFTTIAKLDQLLQVDIVKDFYKKSRSRTNILVFIAVSIHALNCFLEIIGDLKEYVMTLTSFHLFFTQRIELASFFNCVAMVTDRLNVVNKFLDTFVTEQDKKDITVFIVKERKKESKETLNFIGRASENNVKIRDLAAIYDILGRTCMMINKAYNFSLLMILTNSLAFILITFWQALSFYQSQEMDSSDLIYMAVWCMSTISNLIALAFGCERLLRARNKTRILVNKIVMDYDLPRSMRVQAKAFMELVEVWPLHIYIYDMFSVDITLILKFISVATTYLIVIIQISHLI